MDIYLSWNDAHELLRYDEPGIEELVDYWARHISRFVLPSPKAILFIYERLHAGQFQLVDYPVDGDRMDSGRMVLIRVEVPD